MVDNFNFIKYDKIVTADEVLLGELLRIHHRPDEPAPELRLYASYLEIWSILLGGQAFIPTDFIDSYDKSANTIYLTESLKTVQEETWNRAPAFIAGRQGRKEELPSGNKASI